MSNSLLGKLINSESDGVWLKDEIDHFLQLIYYGLVRHMCFIQNLIQETSLLLWVQKYRQ